MSCGQCCFAARLIWLFCEWYVFVFLCFVRSARYIVYIWFAETLYVLFGLNVIYCSGDIVHVKNICRTLNVLYRLWTVRTVGHLCKYVLCYVRRVESVRCNVCLSCMRLSCAGQRYRAFDLIEPRVVRRAVCCILWHVCCPWLFSGLEAVIVFFVSGLLYSACVTLWSLYSILRCGFDAMFILCRLRKQNILICFNILSCLELYMQRDLLSHGGLWSGGDSSAQTFNGEYECEPLAYIWCSVPLGMRPEGSSDTNVLDLVRLRDVRNCTVWNVWIRYGENW
jgi:hypothetical protein